MFKAYTYEELQDVLTESLNEAMRRASTDGRSRRATARGFDFEESHARREQLGRFERMAEARETLARDELVEYLEWWDQRVEPSVIRMVGGLPVDPDVYEMAERQDLVSRFALVLPRGE